MYAEEIISMIDGPKLREQRRAVLQLMDSLDITTTQAEALEGLTNLLDEIADCCHDIYGKDCLLEDPELERLDKQAEEAEYQSIVEMIGACHG